MLAIVIIVGGGFGLYYWLSIKAAPEVTTDFAPLTSTITHDKMQCDDVKYGAIGTLEYGIIDTCGGSDDNAPENEMYPLASMTKIITALVTLDKFSDKLSKDVILDSKDMQIWQGVTAQNGSNIKIYDGEKLTLRKMLEGMIVASANNLADSIVYHFFNTYDEYKVAAEDFFQRNALGYTQIGGDASGFDPQNQASAADMFIIDQLALQNEELARIINLRTTEFPEANKRGIGTEIEQSSTYAHLTKNDSTYLGIKSGTSEQAGYNLSFARKARNVINLETKDIFIGVLMCGDEGYDFHNVTDFQTSYSDRFAPQNILDGGVTIGTVYQENKLESWLYEIKTDRPFTYTLPQNANVNYEFELGGDSETRYSGKLHIFVDYDKISAPRSTSNAKSTEAPTLFTHIHNEIGSVNCSVN